MLWLDREYDLPDPYYDDDMGGTYLLGRILIALACSPIACALLWLAGYALGWLRDH